MKNILLLIFVIQISIYSQTNSEQPIIFYDSCPFECCQFGEWIIEGSINVYPDEGDTNSVSFRLSNNDTINAITGNLYFMQIGKVVVTKPIFNYELNDTLLAFNCTESDFLVKHNGKENYVDIFWPMFFSEEDDTEENYLEEIKKRDYSGKMIQKPKAVWWVKIESEKGKGWIRLENKTPYCFSLEERIFGMDGCG